jgi:hypothetical protein
MFIKPVLASPTQVHEAIERYYHLDTSMNEVVQSIIQSENEIVVSAVAESEERQAIDELMREAEGRPIVRLANWLLHRAVEEGASDIHIEPQTASSSCACAWTAAARGAAAAEVDAGRDRVAHQGALQPRHRREAHAAGRPARGRDRRRAHRHARLDAARDTTARRS